MKILFYNHTAHVSGAERVLGMILSRLNRDHFTPVVLCPAGPMTDLAESNGVPCQNVEQLSARFTWRPDHLLRYVISFARVIREVRSRVHTLQPDIIHANSIRAGLVMTFATAGLAVPIVWHAHDILPRHPFSLAIRFVALVSARTRVLAVSQAVANRFAGWPALRVKSRTPATVIRNSVELERFRHDPPSRQSIRKELGVGEAQPVVGTIGQLTPRKGQLGLINAFAGVLARVPEAVLLIAGEPIFNRDQDYRSSLLRAVDVLGISDQVRFLGSRQDVPAVMQALDLLVVNSLEEPFALVVLEGLASQTAVVATAVGGTPEMIVHGESGWLVPAGDDQLLAEGIVKLLRNPELRAKLAKCGREEANSHYSAERYMREMQNFYRQIGNVRTKVTIQTRREVSENV